MQKLFNKWENKKNEIKKSKIISNEEILSKVITDIYLGIGISSLSEFKNYLSKNGVDLERVKKKIAIEIAWNDLVVDTFKNQIEIDQKKIRKEMKKLKEQEVENLLLSEIIFTINDKKELDLKYNEIKKSIDDIGFEESARIYSLSDSKKDGGKLGWIYRSQLSNEIREGLKEINVGDFSKPIITSGALLY